jgi:hypothetical protein
MTALRIVKADASTSIHCPGSAYFEQRFCVSSRNNRALFREKLEVLCHENDGALFWREVNITAAARLTAEMSPFNGFGAALPLNKSRKPRSNSKPTDHSHALFPCLRTLLLCPGGRARSFASAPLDAELLCRPHTETAYCRRQRDGSLLEYCGNLGDERNLLAGAQCAGCEDTAVEGSENLLGHFVGERDHPVQFRLICHSSFLSNVGGGHSAETARLLVVDDCSKPLQSRAAAASASRICLFTDFLEVRAGERLAYSEAGRG